MNDPSLKITFQNKLGLELETKYPGLVLKDYVAAEDELDELTNLLDCENFDEGNKEELQYIPSSLCEKSEKRGKKDIVIEKSEIHTGDTDSSDDEDNKYSTNRKYSETGQSIKNSLKKTQPSNIYFESSTWKSKKTPPAKNQNSPAPNKVTANDVYSDPFFGIRIITPLVSSQALREKMQGRTAVTFGRLEKHILANEKSSDWVVAGVVVSKFIKTSQKGNPYACWTLSDLKDDLSTISVFLFGSAYKNLWKTSTHTVVAILNATSLEKRQSTKDIAALSVVNSDQVMIWGQSKDLGYCKALKKNGDVCTSFVNKNKCEFCVYHVKQEYGRFTRRAELQGPSGSSLDQLRNKVIGKNEVFYAGKSWTAVPAKQNRKQAKRDQTRLNSLFAQCESRLQTLPTSTSSSLPQSSRVLKMKDAERLQKLTGTPATPNDLVLHGEKIANSAPKKPSFSANSKTDRPLLKTKVSEKIKVMPPSNDSISSKKSKFDAELLAKHTASKLKSENDSDKKVDMLDVGKQRSNSKAKKTIDSQPAKRNISEVKNHDTKRLKSEQETSCLKKLPTKNRFENLTKLTSNIYKTKELDLENKKSSNNKSTPRPKSPGKSKLIDVDMFDISFEFDDKPSNSKPFKSKTLSENVNNSFDSQESENIPTNDVIRLPTSIGKSVSSNNDVDRSNISNSYLNRNHMSSSQKLVQSAPLSERASPAESKLNEINGLQSKHLKQDTKKLEKDSVNPFFSQKCDKIRSSEPSNRHEKLESSNSPNPRKLGSSPPTQPGEQCSSTLPQLGKLGNLSSPMLGRMGSSTLRIPRSSSAKMNALQYVKCNGPIKKDDPKNIEKKRKQMESEDDDKGCAKSLLSEQFLELMSATSKHLDLILNAEDKAIDEYYEKMEQKEKMEEKMLSTYKMDCKAFRCLKCKYKWFTPSDLCKAERHPIKMISAVKRFFQCHNCRHRTVSLELIPLHNCFNCGQANWKRAPMMRERKLTSVRLSIRGDEQSCLNSFETSTNLNLLVPDTS